MVSYFWSSKNSRLVLFSLEPTFFRKSFKTAFAVSLVCACKLSECYFLQAVDWAASVICVSHMRPTSCVVGYPWNMMFILKSVCEHCSPSHARWIQFTLAPYFIHSNFSIVFLMVPILTSTMFSLGFLIKIMSGFLIRSPYSECVILCFKKLR
jgi:hypothetical protein